MRYKATGKSLELLDRANPIKTKYKQKITLELVSFTWTKAVGYIWLNVVIKGELNGKELPVYQIDGKPVELEKVSDFIYRYKAPGDEVREVRVFEVSLTDHEGETKTLRTLIETEPFVYYLTSTIYPINLIEDLETDFKGLSGRMLTSTDLGLKASQYESFKPSIPDKLSGTLAKVLIQHNYYQGATSDVDGLKANIGNLSATLREILRQETLPFEKGAISTIRAITGTLRTILLAYTFYKPEGLLVNTARITGTIDQLPEYFESFINAETPEYDPSDSDGGSNTIIVCDGDIVISDPIVTASTTSALDFENGLVDTVGTTIWTKEGTGNVTSVNKITGTSSFETKALGDSLYTNSNIITGGTTPFTIEFYALIRGGSPDWRSLLSKTSNLGAGEQFFGINALNGNKVLYLRQENAGGLLENTYGTYNVKNNEVNKFTVTYDGAAQRIFINDKLDSVRGLNSGFYTSSDQPFKFFDSLNPSYGSRYRTDGLIDNINIFDGEARVVRDFEEHADKLIVDLSFDGENNSTKIVDNGTEKLTWTVNGNTKLSTDKKFNGFSSLYIGSSVSDYISSNVTDKLFFDKNTDMTIDFLFNKPVDSGSNTSLLQLVNKTVEDQYNRFSFFIRAGSNNLNTCVYANGSTFIDVISNVNLNEDVRYTFLLKKRYKLFIYKQYTGFIYRLCLSVWLWINSIIYRSKR